MKRSLRKRACGLGCLAATLLCGSGASAQPCEPHWDNSIGQPGLSERIRAFTVFDDGGGPALYAGGVFQTAGGEPAKRVAKWDGVSWSALGNGFDDVSVTALTVFDDGTGPALYAGGRFTASGGEPINRVAKWDGWSWSALGDGVDGGVNVLAVFDDGTGPALYAGGSFAFAGEVRASYIAKWDGSSWSAVGGGMAGGVTRAVYDLTVFDDGRGPALYAAGDFTMAGGEPANYLARWDGSSWTSLGVGMGGDRGSVLGLAVHDDGTGEALYAVGRFSTAGEASASRVARWDGSSWSPVGSGMTGAWVEALAVFDDGSGPVLYAGGSFFSAGGVSANRIAKWDGAAWSPLGAGTTDWVQALQVFDDGTGEALYVGGTFTSAGGLPANRAATWRGCPPCYADCDKSGSLDFFDFLCFQDGFAAGETYADCDESGSLDFFDFLCFQNAFAAGCS